MDHAPTSLLIVYHSMTGGTQQMAEAAARGARREASDGARGDAATGRGEEVYPSVSLRLASATGPSDVLNAAGYIFASPENLAAMSGQMKDFFDRTYYAALDRLNGRPYAVLVCAGSDGRNAAQQIERIATGWRLKAVAAPFIVCTNAQTPEQILRPKRIGVESLRLCEELGATLAAGLAMGVF